MSEKLAKFATALTWLIRIASVILGLLGRNDAVGATAAQAAGAFASSADYAVAVTQSENKITAGVVGFLVSFVIPPLVRWIGGFLSTRPNKAGFAAVADRSALETLLLTRAGQPEDLAKVEALMKSGVNLEVQQRIEAASAKGK